MKSRIILVLSFLVIFHCGNSQNKFVVQNKRHTTKVKFKLINNLIIFPLEVNGVELSFLLDTGVSKPMIFNFLNISDSLNIKNTESIYLKGLGEGNSIEALKSKGNVIRIGETLKLNQDLFVIFNKDLNLAPKLGVPVHGIIGLDLFKDLVVEVNYGIEQLILTNPEHYTYKDCNKCETINLEFYNGKPYIYSKVKIENNDILVKLLIDSGGSDALWLFENDSMGLKASAKYFQDFLGHGLSGSVYGKRTKIDGFSLKSFELKNVNTAFPDSSSVALAKRIKNRNGSVSGQILKRFNIIFDYQKAQVSLKRNKYFNERFSYNKSGIELSHNGLRYVKEIDVMALDTDSFNQNTPQYGTRVILDPKYKYSLQPAFVIAELRTGSPAERSGLKIGDIVLKINEKQVHQYSLQDITQMFFGKAGKRIKLKVDRSGEFKTFTFKLENVL